MPEVDQETLDGIEQSTIDDVHGDTEAKLALLIAASAERIKTMVDSGVSDATIESTLASEAGRTALFSGATAAFSQAGAGLISESERLTSVASAQLNTEEKLRWDTVGDGRECEGDVENACAERDGLEKTMTEWEALGVPGSQNLLCSLYSRSGFSKCRCVLGSASVPRTDPSQIDASAAISEGRSRANSQA